MDVRQNLVSWIDRHLFPHHLYLDVPDHNVRDPVQRAAAGDVVQRALHRRRHAYERDRVCRRRNELVLISTSMQHV
jgi:hypothetical protein